MTITSDNAEKLEIEFVQDNSSNVPAKRVDEYRIGGLDKRGRKVLDILWSTKDFVIFQHAKGISPHFSDDDELSHKQAQRYMELGPDLSRINALLPTLNETDDKKRPVSLGWSFFHTPDAFLYRETARAIANALTGDHQRAISTLAFVESRLIARRRAQGQVQYLLACTAILVIIVMIVLFLEFPFPPPETPWRQIVRVAICGAAGGFLSVAIGIRKLDIDPDTRWVVNAFFGLIRLTIAIVSAIILYFLIKAKLILQPVFSGTSDNEAFALYSFAAIAGFSETLIPNILRRTEERSLFQQKEEEVQPHNDRSSIEVRNESNRNGQP